MPNELDRRILPRLPQSDALPGQPAWETDITISYASKKRPGLIIITTDVRVKMLSCIHDSLYYASPGFRGLASASDKLCALDGLWLLVLLTEKLYKQL